MKVDLSNEEGQALLSVLDQINLKVGSQNLTLMQTLVSVQKKIRENNTAPEEGEPSPPLSTVSV